MKKKVPLLNKYIASVLGILFAIFLYERVYLGTKGKFLPEFFSAFGESFLRLGNLPFLVSFGYSFLRSLIGL